MVLNSGIRYSGPILRVILCLTRNSKEKALNRAPKFSRDQQITLVLGNGVGTEFVVPDLFGLTYREARAALSTSGLLVGSVVPDADVKDTMGAFVYRQNPDRFDYDRQLNHIRQGQIIDIWLSAIKKDTSSVQKSIITDQIRSHAIDYCY